MLMMMLSRLLLILHDRNILLLIRLTLSRSNKALPNSHIRLRLRHQRIADILLAPVHPAVIVLVAERPDGHIARSPHELARLGRRL